MSETSSATPRETLPVAAASTTSAGNASTRRRASASSRSLWGEAIASERYLGSGSSL